MKKLYISLGFILLTSVFGPGCEESSGTFSVVETTISGIHQAIKKGDCTCEQLVMSYLKRIETYDQPTHLNAITVINPDARAIARQMDQEYQQTHTLRPLHCIPVIVKDNYNTIGLQTAVGSKAMEGFIAQTDAYQVKALKEAGAIVLAKSNMAEWAFSPRVTISSLAGETLNPYNLEHVPAGSSGGTAAAVAANFGATGLGTDTGNSIRGPSSHNALVGFRTTLGLISREGIVPLYLRNDVGGPMCRTVEDATRMMEVMAGYDPGDTLTRHSIGKVQDNYVQYLDKNGLKGARIGVMRALSDDDPDPEVKALFEQALTDLQKLGAEVIDPVIIPYFDSLKTGQWCSMFQFDLNQYLAAAGPDVPVKSLAEVVASGKYAPYIEDRLKHHVENGLTPGGQEPPCLDAFTDPRRIAFREAIENVMDDLDLAAIVYPTWNHPPAKTGNPEGYKGDNSQVIAPHTGQPAFTVPMGFTSGDLPAGLQFLGRMFDEPRLVSLTYAYEQGTLHRRPPVLFPALNP